MHRSRLETLLDSAFRIQPKEIRRVGFMFVYLTGVISAFIVGRTVRDTLFLSRYAVERLPLMYIAAAAGVSIVSLLYSRVADSLRRDRLIGASLLAAVGSLVLCYAFLLGKWSEAWIYPALYVLVEIIGALSVIQFWTFANDIFNAREAKRLFGIIGAGGVLSNVLCGFAIGAAAETLGTENLILVCAACLIGALLAMRKVAATKSFETKIPRRERQGVGQRASAVLSSKHLQIISGIVGFSVLAVTLIDYQFKTIARQAYAQNEAALASFFGYFFGFTGIIACVIQFGITGRLLQRAGLLVALLFLPAALMMGSISMVCVPLLGTAIATATATKGAENVFRYTINDSTMQLLYVPVAVHQRGRAKAFIDGILKPICIAASGLLILGLSKVLDAQTLSLDLAWVVLFFLTGWITLVVSIRKSYVRSLVQTLHSRRLDLDSPYSLVTDQATSRVLKQALQSSREEDVLHALELAGSSGVELGDDLSPLLGHPSELVRIEAIKLVERAARYEDLQHVEPLLASPSEGVRAAAIGAYCAVGEAQALRTVRAYLEDPSAAVRAAAVAGLVRYAGLDGILTAATTFNAFFRNPVPKVRAEGARILRRIESSGLFQPLLELLQDRDASVRIAAIEAAGSLRCQELIPALIYRLADPEGSRAAARALTGYGPRVERVLLTVLDNPREDLAIRRQVPDILAHIGDKQSFRRLMLQVGADDPLLRGKVAKAAARLRERLPTLGIDDLAFDAALKKEIRGAYQNLALLQDLRLREPSTTKTSALARGEDLLFEAIIVEQRRAQSVIFRLLEIRYPSQTIQLVFSHLDSENLALRANAIEVADNLLSKEECRLLLPLLEGSTLAEKVANGRALFDLVKKTRSEWVRDLLAHRDPWIVTCTLYFIRQERLLDHNLQLLRLLDFPDPIVQETACDTLAELVESGELVELPDPRQIEALVRLRIERGTPPLRRAGQQLLVALETRARPG